MATQEARPLRADARRNRERVLQAAREVFAECGHEAQMDEVAQRAEVGMGTVYRHFPTKDALLAALLVDSFSRITANAIAALDEPDAWTALSGTLWFGAELLASNRALTQSLVAQPADCVMEHEEELRGVMAELIARAQTAGALRADMVVDDVPMLMCGVGAAYQKPHACPESWRRHMSIVLDGLRAPAATGTLPD